MGDKRTWIEPEHGQISVQRQCELIGLARSSWYYEANQETSDEPTCLHTFEESGLRFDSEEAFLDDQSNGWNLQKSQIHDLCALSRLGCLLAVATLYVTTQGVKVVAAGLTPIGFAAIATFALAGTG